MTAADNAAPPRLAAGAPLVKITGSVDMISALFPLSQEGLALRRPGLTPPDFVDLLCGAELWIDAIRFLAHALPRREAVWWACTAARSGLDPNAAAQRQAVETTEAWVYHPDEERRRAAVAAAPAAGNDSPAHWAAMAASWSGGSLAPPEAPVVPPGETLTAQAVAGAVLLAAVKPEPERAPERYRNAVVQAIDIARGGTGRPKPSTQ
jgi:hypothetical protein